MLVALATARAVSPVSSSESVGLDFGGLPSAAPTVGPSEPSIRPRGDRVGCGDANAAPGCHAAWCALTGSGGAHRGRGELP